MHNRHFIISMVIKGEKVPAFSATTLTIPPVQSDFSPQIIDNTRRLYAKERTEVEAMIQEVITPQPNPPTQAPPQSRAQAAHHPIHSGATPVKKEQPKPKNDTPVKIESEQKPPEVNNSTGNSSSRKRSRRRGRGGGGGNGSSNNGGNGQQPRQESPKPAGGETIINLR